LSKEKIVVKQLIQVSKTILIQVGKERSKS